MPHTKYIWDPLSDNVLMEKDENGDTQATNTYLPELYGDLISQRRNGETSYHHFDGQGSTRALTDESENVTDTYTYTAFGEEVSKTGSTENPYRYVGKSGYYFDNETDEYYVRARSYNPSLSRWLSQDPVGFADGTNVYLYVLSNPASQVDPSGRLRESGIQGSASGHMGPCAAYAFATRWELDSGEKNGFILQLVTEGRDVHRCPGEPRPTPCKLNDDEIKKILAQAGQPLNSGPCASGDYVELWRVSDDRIFEGSVFEKPTHEGSVDAFAFFGYDTRTRGRLEKIGQGLFVPDEYLKAHPTVLDSMKENFQRGAKGVAQAGVLFSWCGNKAVSFFGRLSRDRTLGTEQAQTIKWVDRRWNCCECPKNRYSYMGVYKHPWSSEPPGSTSEYGDIRESGLGMEFWSQLTDCDWMHSKFFPD